jgi:hypothetical protein
VPGHPGLFSHRFARVHGQFWRICWPRSSLSFVFWMVCTYTRVVRVLGSSVPRMDRPKNSLVSLNHLKHSLRDML